MRTVATTIVDVPVERVWATLADHEGMSTWGPGLTVTLDKEGVGDRNGLGAVRRIVAKGPAPTIVEEIVAFEPGSRLRYKALSGVPLRNYFGDVSLSPEGSGTRIDYAIEADRRLPVVDGVAARVIARTLLTMLARAARKA